MITILVVALIVLCVGFMLGVASEGSGSPTPAIFCAIMCAFLILAIAYLCGKRSATPEVPVRVETTKECGK